uniref:Uncharacterized protein n=1 Tax=Oryza sativa subsp. japonica TaxID=39947 RepID=I7GSI8_ORYSJ|nr:hypothetical protein [Oryza sativa Japonica Group]
MAGVGGRLGTATARVVRRTMTRLKDGGAPWDYEEAYPVLYLGGGGPRGRRLRVGHGGCGGRLCRRETRRQGRLLCRRRSVAFQTEAATVGFVASRRSGQRGGVGWARQGIGQRRGRGVVSFAQSCSEICGQRRNGRLGGDDFRLASYVFDEMSARKEMGKRREGWGAGPLAGGV